MCTVAADPNAEYRSKYKTVQYHVKDTQITAYPFIGIVHNILSLTTLQFFVSK